MSPTPATFCEKRHLWHVIASTGAACLHKPLCSTPSLPPFLPIPLRWSTERAPSNVLVLHRMASCSPSNYAVYAAWNLTSACDCDIRRNTLSSPTSLHACRRCIWTCIIEKTSDRQTCLCLIAVHSNVIVLPSLLAGWRKGLICASVTLHAFDWKRRSVALLHQRSSLGHYKGVALARSA